MHVKVAFQTKVKEYRLEPDMQILVIPRCHVTKLTDRIRIL